MKKNLLSVSLAALTLAAAAFTSCGDKEPANTTVKVATVTVSPATHTLEIGKTVTLGVTVTPADATNPAVTWESSNSNIATVDQSGLVTARAEGPVTITATAADGGGAKNTCAITVVPEPIPGAVSIAGDGFDIDDVQDITYTEATTPPGFPVKVNITSARGIDKLLIEITSSSKVFEEALVGMGFVPGADLANPEGLLLESLEGLGGMLPYGEQVKGKAELAFDITSFIPMIFTVAGECTADFKLTAMDDTEVQATKTLKLNLIDDRPGAVSIAGEGFDIDQMVTNPADGATFKIKIEATKGIENLLVNITSTSQTLNGVLGVAGLTGEFDIANPSAELEQALGMLEGALPYGADVKGKNELTLDATGLVPILTQFTGGTDCSIFIAMTVKDRDALSASKTLKLNFGPQLPNGGFDGWTKVTLGSILKRDVWYPYADAATQFWDTANEGASTVSSNNITMYDEADKRPGTAGTRSVKMQSKYVLIKFAAGNIYSGKFGGVSGTSATVNFGRPFTSRPAAMTGWYKASPGVMDYADAASGKSVGDQDEYQIYVMLTNWAEPRLVNPADAGSLIDFGADYVVGFGQISDAGVDTSKPVTEWSKFNIPITYKSNETPTYIVVVACASKYGDYFTGSTSSVLQIDDFELIY
jgi:hypothetical protein